MLSIAVLTNEVCTAWSDAFFVFASNCGVDEWLIRTVLTLYTEAYTAFRTNAGLSESLK